MRSGNFIVILNRNLTSASREFTLKVNKQIGSLRSNLTKREGHTVIVLKNESIVSKENF